MKFQQFFESKLFIRIIEITLAVILLLLVFAGGVFVGNERAKFSFNWRMNNTFTGMPQGRNGPIAFDANTTNPRGSSGQIVSVSKTTITVMGSNGTIQTITIDPNTVIKNSVQIISIADLKPNEHIVVIGNPSDAGQIVAKFIRVLPTN